MLFSSYTTQYITILAFCFALKTLAVHHTVIVTHVVVPYRANSIYMLCCSVRVVFDFFDLDYGSSTTTTTNNNNEQKKKQ